MADPALNLQVTADITALTTSMQKAQQSVQQGADRMSSSIRNFSSSISQRFDESFSNINRGFGRVSRGAQVGLAAASAAAGDLDGTLNALPGTLGAVASTGKVLYDVLHEMFTGAKAAADELAKSIETGQRIMDFRQQAKDLGLQLQAMKELDPIEARRIETQRQLNQVRAEFNRLNTEGAAPQALEALKTREQIILLQEENDVRKIRNELNRKGLEAAKTQSDQQDEDAKLAADSEEARIAKRRELFELRTKMAMAEEPENRRRLALEQQLLEIDQRRDDSIRKRSDYLADEIAQAEKNLAIAEAVGEMETELAEKRLDLMNEEEAARQRMQGVTTVEASFGGALRVANDAAARGQLVATEKQTQIQEEIRNLLRDISNAQRFAGIQ